MKSNFGRPLGHKRQESLFKDSEGRQSVVGDEEEEDEDEEDDSPQAIMK